ncbi:hypothetical protein P168DRAFT_324809 [Aspergillus campestris IBT 28561]|uniref:C2H2-type domain-containing protein n=1 Tax=Aspergillus campestris (strain IBT 28561) TaxID=1392248 RepID=A0A2I1DC05_ASPC2|nr:uncharacterized protein P168DRAFT_324809 [Aspergillus campestris IBT 28561]PKY07390.1 hypothetical protein P168DRAFT_324809 [Aspergillus campestris IBT 28561]
MPRTSTYAKEVPLPVTYTPTTHRISKAKKGKRVHACQYPGCAKVFTRAEHRRRHELNHNPEALFGCTQDGCNKAFHRPDLLARHMERHDLETQLDTASWEQPTHAPVVDVPFVPTKETNTQVETASRYLAVTNSMSIGSLVGPAIHPDLQTDYSMMWPSQEHHLHADPHPPMYPSHHVHESVEEHRFYATPESCPSPSSDGTSLSIPSHPRSSLSATPVAVIDHYPDTSSANGTIIESTLSSSPIPMHATHIPHHHHQPRWDAEPALPPVPLNVHDAIMHHPVAMPCSYPSPSWPSTHHLSYDDTPHYSHEMPWRSWTM